MRKLPSVVTVTPSTVSASRSVAVVAAVAVALVQQHVRHVIVGQKRAQSRRPTASSAAALLAAPVKKVYGQGWPCVTTSLRWVCRTIQSSMRDNSLSWTSAADQSSARRHRRGRWLARRRSGTRCDTPAATSATTTRRQPPRPRTGRIRPGNGVILSRPSPSRSRPFARNGNASSSVTIWYRS